MATLIVIRDTYKYNASVCFGLSVTSEAKFPVVVGCSVRTPAGQIIDIPARYLESPGRALWPLRAPDPCFVGMGDPSEAWVGQVIFAVYEDATFGVRLADTGWVDWSAPSLVGTSTAGLDLQDREIESVYGNRKGVLKPLDG